MTEEEKAEEYAEKQNLQNVNPSGIVRCKLSEAYFAGADFGYKKGYHDAEEHYMNVIDNQHKLVAKSKKELEQENNKLLDVINNQDVKIADLEKQIEKMQNCRNCKNYMVEGVCGHFTQVGWCKSWEMKEYEK